MGRMLGFLGMLVGAAAVVWAADDIVTSKKNAQQKKCQALLEQKALWIKKLETRKKQLKAEREAAEELRQKKFFKKVAWSAVRHAVMAILLPGIGNLAEKAYFTLDAMDLADLIDVR